MLAAFNTQDCFSGFAFYNEKTPIIVGAVLAVLFGVCVLGGGKRLTKVTEVLVPVMGILYVLVSLFVVITHITALPRVFGMIFRSAFDFRAIFGGFTGSCIMWGIKRGLYSNEAGMGSAPNAAASADVAHPAKQGLVQMLSVFIDTLLICSATAFMCLFSGVEPSSEAAGAAYVQAAARTALGGFGPVFLAVAVSLFAFTTLLGNYYYTEGCLRFLMKKKPGSTFMTVFRLCATALVFLGAVISAGLAWDTADLLQALMVIINVPVILLLAKPALDALKDYEAQRKAGKEPVYHAAANGIQGTEQLFFAHGGIDGLAAGHGDRSRRKPGAGAFRSIQAPEVCPDQRRHKGIAAAGGVHRDLGQRGKPDPLLSVRGQHAFLSHGDIDLLQPGLQQGVGSAVQIVLVGDPDAGEQFGLQLIRLQRVQAGQNRPQFFRLGNRDGVGEDRHIDLGAEPADGLLRDVRIQNQGSGCAEQRQLLLQRVGRQEAADLHIRDGQMHLARMVGKIKIGRGRLARNRNGILRVDADLAAGAADDIGIKILAEGRDQSDRQTEQAQVVGNVPADAARACADPAGVGVRQDQRLKGLAADIDVHPADDRGISAAFSLLQHVFTFFWPG